VSHYRPYARPLTGSIVPRRLLHTRVAVPGWYYLVSGFFVLDTMQAFGFINGLVYGPWAPGSNTVTQALNWLMFAASLTLFANGFRRSAKGFTMGSVLAFSAVAFMGLSALWSGAPAVTIRECIVYLFVIIGVIGIAGTMAADEYMHLLSWCCFLSAIASIVLLIGFPSLASQVSPDRGSQINGIFATKGILGMVMATGVLATLHGIRVGRRRYLGKLCMLFVFIAVAYVTKSATALMVVLVICGIGGLDSLLRKGGSARQFGIILAVVLAPIFIVAVAAPDVFLEMIGRDPTLTGRTEIWAYVEKDIWLKPWLGWGYFGFWQLSNPAALEISDAVHWVVPHAHNGLLEMLVNIGVLGTALFAFILIRNLVLAVRCLRTPERALAISTISGCAVVLVLGVSETVLLQATEPSTPFLFITGLMCERALYVARGLRRYRVPVRLGHKLMWTPPLARRFCRDA
jgi:exopolysaccharide production protein ExoQ